MSPPLIHHGVRVSPRSDGVDTRRCTLALADLDELARLRAALWTGMSVSHQRAEIAAASSARGEGVAVLAARVATGEMVGFAEAAVRRDHVNGCDTTPVVFLEGIYVLPEHRHRGIAGSLCAAVEAWGRSLECVELGSDADAADAASHAFHAALGFEGRERVVFFRKRL